MDRRTFPIEGDTSHQGMAFRPAGSKERDEYLKTFPWPLPSTHYLHWEWNPELTEVSFEVRIKPAAGESAQDSAAAADADAHRKELEGKTVADLQAYAAEIGAELAPKMTKAAMIAVILDTLAKSPAE